MFSIIKKIIPIFLTITLISGIFPSIFYLKETKAVAPPTTVPIWIEGSSILQIGQEKAVQTFIEKVIKVALATLLETLRKQLLDSFVDSIIKWIQGVDDKPAFITNVGKFFGDVVNEAVGEYIQTTQAAFLCQPFQFQVIVNLPQPGRPPLPTCTLNQIVGNIEDFYDDFRNGGWVAYNEMLYPWNNPYGSYLMALDGAIYEAAKAVSDKEKETAQSQGFLNTKRCIKCLAYSDTVAGPIPHPGETSEQCEAIKNSGLRDFQCLEEEVTTPGGLIAGQVQKALNVDIDYILSSTELSTYLAAIFDALINRLFRAGVDGLLGILTPNAQENLGYDAPTGIKYKCDEDTDSCVADSSGTYDDKATCDSDCAGSTSTTPSCDNCTGIYVRGRYCNGNVCGKCSSVSPGTGACGAFCQNIVSSELWPKLGVPETFGSDVLDQYKALFDKYGYAVPSRCTCNRAILGKQWASYGISAGGGSCRDCTGLPIGRACTSVDWCEENCSGG